MRDSILKHKNVLKAAFQLLLLSLIYFLSFLLRFDFRLTDSWRDLFLLTLPLVLLVKLPVFAAFGLFRGWWRYAGMNDLLDISRASVAGAAVLTGALYYCVTFGALFSGYPRSVLIIDLVLTILGMGGARFAVRLYTETAQAQRRGIRTLIIGTGRRGTAIARELKGNSELHMTPVGFIDDDPARKGVRLFGLRVLGTVSELPSLLGRHRIRQVLVAVPSAQGEQLRGIVEACRMQGAAVKTVPALTDIIGGRISVRELRNVRLDDLLGRQTVQLNYRKIREKLQDKVALVTGAGGSIGSELARQIAGFGPSTLVLFERSENDLYHIDAELQNGPMQVKHVAVVGDIRDSGRLNSVLSAYRPDFIFHAAAHKHVPLMERNCFEAVKNNIVGTCNLATLARYWGVADFVMISSDKAVNPTNVMGATKRFCELLMSGMAQSPTRGSTRFVSVRFGNVLGSRGSVVPAFERQIANREAITITHPEARRYFMTVSEAVALVLEASTMGTGGETFVLDMGEPVKILDLARHLIQLSGLEPGKDIEIRFTGLRPGEKLHEDLKLSVEGMKTSAHNKIRVVRGEPVDLRKVLSSVVELEAVCDAGDLKGLMAKLKEVMPEYTPSSELVSQSLMRPRSNVVPFTAAARPF
jgi:FlaA1/EpsC-like NDP-sugar epimerase